MQGKSDRKEEAAVYVLRESRRWGGLNLGELGSAFHLEAVNLGKLAWMPLQCVK